jgi:hypothetical protein
VKPPDVIGNGGTAQFNPKKPENEIIKKCGNNEE